MKAGDRVRFKNGNGLAGLIGVVVEEERRGHFTVRLDESPWGWVYGVRLSEIEPVVEPAKEVA